ncbi:MAG: VWA domain-containing protein [Ignavibacteriales bacterium]|nr:VWA domain-containing protein [Ignavibacteriales bacterium]
MLRFEHPDLLWFLLALPVLAAGLFALRRRQKRLLAGFASPGLLRELAPDMSAAKRAIKNTLGLVALGFVIVAAANPQVGTRLEEIKREGIDLFVALDVSLSMKAEDIRPNRLEKAKRDVSALLNKLQGDRVGLIVFAGDAFVQFPLTSDYSAADLFISAVDVDAVPTPGTMIASAIELVLKSFPEDLPTEKALIIVSDGEDTEGDLDAAIKKATSAGVKVFTVGMGTVAGGPIPLYDASGNRADYKRDRRGSIVISKLEETTLRQLASPTGGSYRRATSGGNEIDEIYDELLSLERVAFDSKQVTGYESMYQYPLALAILFLILDFLLSEKRGTLLRVLRRLIPAAAVLAVLAMVPVPLSAQTHRSLIGSGNDAYEKNQYPDAETQYKKAFQKYPDSRIARFNMGNAYYKQQRFDEANQIFGEYAVSSENPTDASMASYNLGNSLFQTGKLDESIEAYKQALRLNPHDEDARYNLELARRKKHEQEQKNQQDQKQNQNQKKDKQQEQQKKEDPKEQKDEGQQQPEQQNQQQRNQQQIRQQAIPKEQAERILEALRNNEKEIQKQLRKRERTRVRTEKDW